MAMCGKLSFVVSYRCLKANKARLRQDIANLTLCRDWLFHLDANAPFILKLVYYQTADCYSIVFGSSLYQCYYLE